jgi:long-chain acyl-CoA synthetase
MTEGSSLARVLLQRAQQQPKARFLFDTASGERLTYNDACGRVLGFGSQLHAAGVQPGDRVAILVENTWHWPVAFLGAAVAGAIAVPLNTRWAADELDTVLVDCDPVAIVVDQHCAPKVNSAWSDRLWPVERVAVDGRDDNIAWDESAVGGAITYTSGTTGAPKGVVLSHQAMVDSARTYAALFESASDMRTAISVPLFHNTGFIDGLGHAIVAGGSADLYRRFDPASLAARLSDGTYNFFIGVPTKYRRALDHLAAGAVVGGHRQWLAYGGAPMPPATARALRARLPDARLVNCYGMSEATSITHYLPHDMQEGNLDAVGIPVPGTRDRISETSELEIWSPTAMVGYWNRPEETAAKLRHGWLRTGDCATRSESGIVRITGRADDVINRGGEKISPYEVESVLCELPGVEEALVVGVPHRDLGEVPIALVVPVPNHILDDGQILAELRQRLADYKVPARIISIHRLPRNANGKVLRREAAALAARRSPKPHIS